MKTNHKQKHVSAVIFDLDGVITDTAEFHYQAWQQLADEEGLTFNRDMNEQLRGVPRRGSLIMILNGRSETEERIQEMMARKNSYYVAKLDNITPDDLLPGVAHLLDQLDQANIPYAIASASKNAPAVCHRLGISHRLAALADGHSVPRQKPYPDLFRYAAAKVNVPTSQCLVVEDAAAGVSAALAAGIPTLALGPAERFTEIIKQNGRFTRRDDLNHILLDDLNAAAQIDERWHIVQNECHPNQQHHMETLFTIGNGTFATRGTFAEGYPNDKAITFAHNIWDDMPVSFTELVNLPNWLDFNLSVDGERFQLDKGTCLHFQRSLNLQQGILRRAIQWQAPNGKIIDLLFERFISYPEEQVGAMRVLVTAVSHDCTLTIHTGIAGHVANEDLLHWHLGEQGQTAEGLLWLNTITRHTQIPLTTAAKVSSNGTLSNDCQACPGHPHVTITHTLASGHTLQVDKVIAYVMSDGVNNQDGNKQAEDGNGRASTLVQTHTYDTLRQSHIAAWQQLWQDCDIVLEGDDAAQQAIRFNLFQLRAAAPQTNEHASIGAKALTGYGYRGHIFWDTETFMLPFFIYTQPQLARNMLMYRYHTLAGARRKAAHNGFAGAQYAWESAATGDEVTPTWLPDAKDRTKLIRIWTGDIQIHISADIAYAIMQYWQVTGDDTFLRDYGAEIILDTARFWGSRAEREETNNGHQYVFRDVIGPDEYHEHVDNNSFTNYMARWHLQTALNLLDWLQNNYPAKAKQLTTTLQLTEAQQTHWQDVIDHILLLYDESSGLIDQFEGFFELEPVSPKFVAQAEQSLQLIFGIEGANKRQLLKQADVIMLLCLFRDAFDQKTWQTNWDAYMPITDHVYGSSLGPSFHAWAACEMNRPEEAYKHFMLAANVDLKNPRGNANDGIHAASAGGIWQALIFGFAGLRHTASGQTISPKWPQHWRRLSFKYRYHGQQYSVDIQNPNHSSEEVID